MTDEQRLQLITEQLILVRDNLFRGMSKSIQKLQSRSINEVLELPSHMESPPAQQEPVAWMHTDGRIWTFGRGLDKSTFTIPLYTKDQLWREPLTDEFLRKLHHIDEFGLFCDYDDFEQIARAIEAAHGITGEQK